MKKRQAVQNYGMECQTKLDEECENNAVCSDKMICSCLPEQFWNTNDHQCQTIKQINANCPSGQNDECESNSQCLSDVCRCTSGSFWKTRDRTCQMVDGYNSDCPAQDDACTPGRGLVCTDNKCLCTDGYFWHTMNEICETRKKYRKPCLSGQHEECLYNLQCLDLDGGGSLCVCNPSDFWRVENTNCHSRLTYDQQCYIYSSNPEVQSCTDPLTECVNYPNSNSNRCRCDPDYFRNIDQNQCVPMAELKVIVGNIVSRTKEFDLSWTGPGTALEKFIHSYIVHWSPANENEVDSVNVGMVTTKKITNLKEGATYKVWVVSVEGASRPDRQYTVIPEGEKVSKQTVPGEPGQITTQPSYLTAPNFILKWTPSPGYVDTYSISMKELDRNNKQVNNTVSHKFSTTNTQPQVFVYSLKHGHRYDVNITAHKGVLESRTHRETIKTVSTAPGAPRNVQCGWILDTEITLSWEEPNQPNGYIEFYRVVTSLRSYPYSQLPPEDTENYDTIHTVKGLQAATNYKFTVAASNDLPGVGSSKEVYCTTADASSVSPTNFNVGTITSRKAELSWKRPVRTYGDIQSYTVLVKNDGNKCIQRIVLKCNDCQSPNDAWKNYCLGRTVEDSVIQITDENLMDENLTVSYTVEELDPDTHYTVLVFASNMRPGHPTNETVKTNEEVPQVPYDVEATDVKTTSLTLRWKLNGPRPGVTKYTVSVTEVFDGEATILPSIDIIGFENKETKITDLEEYVNYTFSVIATTGAGASISSVNITERTHPA
ncbi:hypothetical protein ScPMuIL_012959, partial [Solemya velum]